MRDLCKSYIQTGELGHSIFHLHIPRIGLFLAMGTCGSLFMHQTCKLEFSKS